MSDARDGKTRDGTRWERRDETEQWRGRTSDADEEDVEWTRMFAAAFVRALGRRDYQSLRSRTAECEEAGNRKRIVQLAHAGVLLGRGCDAICGSGSRLLVHTAPPDEGQKSARCASELHARRGHTQRRTKPNRGAECCGAFLTPFRTPVVLPRARRATARSSPVPNPPWENIPPGLGSSGGPTSCGALGTDPEAIERLGSVLHITFGALEDGRASRSAPGNLQLASSAPGFSPQSPSTLKTH